MKERIQKSLGNAGVASRRSVEQLVLEGRVAVNGRILAELPILIDPERDKVEVDGETIKLAQRRSARRVYLLLNKPKGVYSTNVAQGVQTRAVDLLPQGLPERVYPVGRLDAESKGLLLLTNDGELTHRLTHPKFGVPRSYRAIVDGAVGPAVVSQLEKGVWLADARTGRTKKTGKSQVRVVKRAEDQSVLEITMREGVNPQVRRMLAKLGHKVRDLTRIRLGSLTLEGLAVGKIRPLTPREVSEIKRLAQRGDGGESSGGGSHEGSGVRVQGSGADSGGGSGQRSGGTGVRVQRSAESSGVRVGRSVDLKGRTFSAGTKMTGRSGKEGRPFRRPGAGRSK